MSLFNLSYKNLNELPENQEAYIFGIFSDSGITEKFKDAHPKLSKKLNLAIENGEFEGKLNQVMVMYSPDCDTAKRYMAIGLGESKKYTADYLRQTSATAAKKCIDLKLSTFAIEFMGEDLLEIEDAQALAEGLVMGSYRFLNYKKQADDTYAGIQSVIATANANLTDALDYGMKISGGVVLARDLGNHPSNIATPTYLADTAEVIAKKGGMKLTIYEREDFEKLGFGGIGEIGRASCRERV